MLEVYAQACGWVLARAHAKASEISATISGCVQSTKKAGQVKQHQDSQPRGH
jgi:hypothetical protein